VADTADAFVWGAFVVSGSDDPLPARAVEPARGPWVLVSGALAALLLATLGGGWIARRMSARS